MEIHKNTNQQLNDLLNEARHEKPVMNLKEVENVISEGKYAPAGSNRGFHIGMNNMIVVCGIVISSFLAYMAMKVDSGDLVTSYAVPAKKEVAVSQPLMKPVVSPSVTSAAAAVKHSALKTSDRVQPKQNAATLLASADKNLVAAENTPVEENIIEPVISKSLSVEYEIGFNMAGQDVKMRLVGDNISEFSIDGKLIPADEYEDYDDIIANAKNYVIGNTHTEKGSTSLNLITYFDAQLRADQILKDEPHYKFELTSAAFLINDILQPDDMFKKYRDVYQAKTGKVITNGSVYKFER